jgi:MarR family transcriptional regulator, lower aerobic nicotinate degradation pathway regulator
LSEPVVGGVSGDGFEIDEHVGFALRVAYQRASANLTDAIGAFGITPMEFQTLRRLRRRGQMAQNELGRSVGMPPANIHRTVRRLVASGLVAVASEPSDRRLTVVELTHQGERMLRQILPAADAANRLTLSALTPDEQGALMRALWKLASGPDGGRAPSPPQRGRPRWGARA